MSVSEHANYLLNEYGRLQFDYAAYYKPYGESLRNEARNNLEEYIVGLEKKVDSAVKEDEMSEESKSVYVSYIELVRISLDAAQRIGSEIELHHGGLIKLFKEIDALQARIAELEVENAMLKQLPQPIKFWSDEKKQIYKINERRTVKSGSEECGE